MNARRDRKPPPSLRAGHNEDRSRQRALAPLIVSYLAAALARPDRVQPEVEPRARRRCPSTPPVCRPARCSRLHDRGVSVPRGPGARFCSTSMIVMPASSIRLTMRRFPRLRVVPTAARARRAASVWGGPSAASPDRQHLLPPPPGTLQPERGALETRKTSYNERQVVRETATVGVGLGHRRFATVRCSKTRRPSMT